MDDLAPDVLKKEATFDIFFKLFSEANLSVPRRWFTILWAFILRFALPILCIATYITMLNYKSTKYIIIAMYIFFGIFWGFFPYAFKCIMLYNLTSISTCVNTLFYAFIGLICWIVALAMYNEEEFKRIKEKATAKTRAKLDKWNAAAEKKIREAGEDNEAE
jgi:hypothetical protein